MKIINLILVSLFSICSSSQTNQKINLYAGIKIRVTPIYSGGSPQDLIIRFSGNLNSVQQPDRHISGLGLLTAQTYKINNQWLFNFQQTTRYDILYDEFPLINNLPYVKISSKKRLIFDLNMDIGRRFQSKKQEFSASLGLGLSGLNTGYTQVIRQYSSATAYIEYKEKIDFLFPSVSAGFGWQKGKFLTQIKMGYCWENPTWSIYPFFFPELSLQYRIK